MTDFSERLNRLDWQTIEADIADITVAIAKLPPLAHVPELVIKPIGQSFI